MVNSRRRAEVIDNARHHDANNPYKEIDVDKPRFKSYVGRNDVRLQQGENHNKEYAGEHVSDKFCHAININKKNVFLPNTFFFNNSLKNIMRAGPQLRVDAFSISNYGSAIFVQAQPQHSPMMLLTPAPHRG